MKASAIKIAVLLFAFIISSSYSQEKSNKERKQRENSEKEQLMENLLISKEFVFTAERAIPLNSPSVTLSSTNNFIKFHHKTMDGYLPYYGRAYSGMPYGGELGIMFNDKPSEYKLIKNKKNYEIHATIGGENDIYKLTLTIDYNGGASLNVNCIKKSSISYIGTVSTIVNDSVKKE